MTIYSLDSIDLTKLWLFNCLCFPLDGLWEGKILFSGTQNVWCIFLGRGTQDDALLWTRLWTWEKGRTPPGTAELSKWGYPKELSVSSLPSPDRLTWSLSSLASASKSVLKMCLLHLFLLYGLWCVVHSLFWPLLSYWTTFSFSFANGDMLAPPSRKDQNCGHSKQLHLNSGAAFLSPLVFLRCLSTGLQAM